MRAIADNLSASVLKEQFIPDNVFLYVVKGEINFYDGDKRHTLGSGECGVARKNHLAKFRVTKLEGGFEPILFCFDEPFLRAFQQKHHVMFTSAQTKTALVKLTNKVMIHEFINSIKPYYKGVMELDEAFEDLKYEELLIILLRNQPELAGLFFDFAAPGKINLEDFMNRNYKFNVSLIVSPFSRGVVYPLSKEISKRYSMILQAIGCLGNACRKLISCSVGKVKSLLTSTLTSALKAYHTFL
ncbi:hypothetical protein QWZ01_08210 [Mucilaginibacter aquaedulcis]|nr:hypothetical protein [Mucilaginibacter aquaedulcis]MDN3548350.1 hypothetical protein [Mucilaginibacter aquaedulcis]